MTSSIAVNLHVLFLAIDEKQFFIPSRSL